jgi:hypothetical protein
MCGCRGHDRARGRVLTVALGPQLGVAALLGGERRLEGRNGVAQRRHGGGLGFRQASAFRRRLGLGQRGLECLDVLAQNGEHNGEGNPFLDGAGHRFLNRAGNGARHLHLLAEVSVGPDRQGAALDAVADGRRRHRQSARGLVDRAPVVVIRRGGRRCGIHGTVPLTRAATVTVTVTGTVRGTMRPNG